MAPDRARQALRGAAIRAAWWALAATLALVAVLVLRTRQVGLAWHLYLIALGTIALVTLCRIALGAQESERVRAPGRRPEQPPRVRQLEQLERAASFSLVTAFDAHYRLRPRLVAIAEDRLAGRGLSLARDLELASRLLGPVTWELVRPGRPAPADRNAAGIGLDRLRAVVAALEEL